MNGYFVLAAAASFGVTALLGLWLIPFLRRLKYGQTILEIGPAWHKNKQGTPTMGGLMFIAGVLCAVASSFSAALLAHPELAQGYHRILNTRLVAGLLMAVGFSLIGFADDYVDRKSVV